MSLYVWRTLPKLSIRAARLHRRKHLITSSDVALGKPASDPYVKRAEGLRIAPKNCIAIPKMLLRVIRSGKAAGARVLVPFTTMERHLLMNAGSDWVAPDFSAIAVEQSANDGRIVLNFNVSGCPPSIQCGYHHK
jgi:beta-phosphoglucomutase-like phosphatase (HAD superfamily)